MADVNNCLLVIPSFRDSGRLGKFLPDLLRVLPSGFSIRIVDDGSGSEESERLKALVVNARETLCVKHGAVLLDPVILPGNQGKGSAVYAGWNAGPLHDAVGFIDADGAVSAEELLRMWMAWPTISADALIGSRVKMLGRDVQRLEVRHYAGRVFATLASAISGLPVYDSQCGCKLIARSAWESAAALGLRASRFAFDVELLVALSQSGCRVVEFPVDWREVGGGKVNLLRDAVSMVQELIEIRRRLGRVPS